MKFTYYNQISIVSVFISTPSPGCSFEFPLGLLLREVWIKLLQTSRSEVALCSTQPLSLTLRDTPIRKKKVDLLSFSFPSVLMIPSLSFWEDLSSPLTPVRRGRLKQLKVPSISRLAQESSGGLLGNAKRQEPQFSVHLEGRSHPSTIFILIYFIEVTSLCGRRPPASHPHLSVPPGSTHSESCWLLMIAFGLCESYCATWKRARKMCLRWVPRLVLCGLQIRLLFSWKNHRCWVGCHPILKWWDVKCRISVRKTVVGL